MDFLSRIRKDHRRKVKNSITLNFSIYGLEIDCNCDDQKTGLHDENVLTSMDQLPVTGMSSMSLNSETPNKKLKYY